MKITKKQLKRIIKEEILALDEAINKEKHKEELALFLSRAKRNYADIKSGKGPAAAKAYWEDAMKRYKEKQKEGRPEIVKKVAGAARKGMEKIFGK